MNDFLAQRYYGNTVGDYLIVMSITLASLIVLKVLKSVIIRRFRAIAARTQGTADDFVVNGVDKFGLPIILFCVVYWALGFLVLSDRASRVIDVTPR